MLIGTSHYESFENIPAIKNNLEALRTFLTSSDGWGLPTENCTVVADPKTASEIVGAVQAAADSATDTLLVYFAGHGVLDEESRFYLTLQGSADKEPWTCVAYEWLSKPLTRSKTLRRIAIIDSCFSGKVHKRGLMSDSSASSLVKSEAAASGTIVLTSARDDRVSLAPPGESYTAFTGELLNVLNQGIPGDPSHISIQRAYEWIRDTLKAKGRPRPDCTGGDTAASTLIARNRSTVGPETPTVSGTRRRTPADELLALTKRIDLKANEGIPPEKEAEPLAGRYRVLGTLGHGGNGWVFRAWDIALNRVVAVKWVGSSLIQGAPIASLVPEQAMFSLAAAFEAMLNEARAVASLNHPGIVAVYDVLDQRPSGYIVMEYIAGETLESVISNHRLSPEESVAVVHETLGALAHSHAAGILHGDVKPGNVMLTVDGSVKLLDFGAAQLKGKRPDSFDYRLTQTIIGTLAYISPESLTAARQPGEPSDLYSMALVFRELLTGTSPSKGQDFGELIQNRMSGRVELPSEISPELGTQYDKFTLKALSSDPDLRFQSANEMRQALEAL
ncbi:protein kinase [Streptomyces sp. NPDC087219]|uniref:caspase, EACC1-associated type n=1 Tax=Streptomyces sp. NPDC087219 TaxID=3365770 RepID=UPI00381BD523